MIQSLKIKDFALIKDIDINFNEGLTVLTGETGAGKSIILESLHLLFGKRSDAEMIRHGKDKAVITGFFTLNTNQQETFDLPEIIEITREVDINGRHKMFINNELTTVANIKKITETIGSIHSQNDTFVLLDSLQYLSFLDLVDENKTNKFKSKYLLERSKYLDAKKHLATIQSKKNDDIEQKEYLEYQIKELQAFNFEIDEKENLEDKYEKLKHFDKISSSLKEAYQLLHEDVSVDQIYDAAKTLEKITGFDSEYKISSEKLLDIYYEFEEVKGSLSNKLNELDYDENEFNFIQERLYDLNKIEEKYHKTIPELITYLDEIIEKIELIDNYDDYINKLSKELDVLFTNALNEGIKLSDYRKKIALTLEKDLITELKDLDLENANFKIIFNEIDEDNQHILLDSGIDEIEFLISLNEGEPLKTLSKVASGGEKARFMFALKTIFARQNNLSLLVLDEIDIGISGKTAAKMANKMSSLAGELQLIVITHLPQVAARANTHFGIVKVLDENRMTTTINELSYDERVEMIALMLSDEQLSHFAIEQAKMLLKK